MTIKIAIIGAGSIGFTKKLVSDILKVAEFADIEIALTDISGKNLDMATQIIRRIVEVNKLPTRVTATTDRRKAFEGAKYIMNCVRVGGLEAYATDVNIPLKYGIDQCVGDTICAGVWPAHHGHHDGFLPGHARRSPRRSPSPQLCQPHGHEHLGLH
jgi:alpha-galactosidase